MDVINSLVLSDTPPQSAGQILASLVSEETLMKMGRVRPQAALALKHLAEGLTPDDLASYKETVKTETGIEWGAIMRQTATPLVGEKLWRYESRIVLMTNKFARLSRDQRRTAIAALVKAYAMKEDIGKVVEEIRAMINAGVSVLTSCDGFEDGEESGDDEKYDAVVEVLRPEQETQFLSVQASIADAVATAQPRLREKMDPGKRPREFHLSLNVNQFKRTVGKGQWRLTKEQTFPKLDDDAINNLSRADYLQAVNVALANAGQRPTRFDAAGNRRSRVGERVGKRVGDAVGHCIGDAVGDAVGECFGMNTREANPKNYEEHLINARCMASKYSKSQGKRDFRNHVKSCQICNDFSKAVVAGTAESASDATPNGFKTHFVKKWFE